MKLSKKVFISLLSMTPFLMLPTTISCSNSSQEDTNYLILGVSIKDLEESYVEGDKINLIARLKMLDGSIVPPNGITYKWFIQDQVKPISTEKSCSFEANYKKHNEKKIRLEATYNGQTVLSEPITLNIKPTSNSNLNNEIERIKNLSISLLDSTEITKTEYDKINEKNILEKINIDLRFNDFDYEVTEFSKLVNKATFKLKVRIKNNGSFYTVDRLFEVDFNIQPYITNVSFTGLKGSDYFLGEKINLSIDKVTMSKGEVPKNIKYEWYISNVDGTNPKNIGYGDKLSYEINVDDLGERIIKVKTIYNNVLKYSSHEYILIKRYSLTSEIERIKGLKVDLNKSDEITQQQFNGIKENVINIFEVNLDLNKINFDYQVEITGRTTNQIKFKIKVSIHGEKNFHLVDNEFTATFNVLPIIEKVEIVGLEPSYIDGQEVNLNAKITMSNGAQLPQEDLTYEWLLNGMVIPNQNLNTCSFKANFADDNKNIKLKVKYIKGDSMKESFGLILEVNKNSQQLLEDEINRINALNENVRADGKISRNKFNAIKSENFIEFVEGGLNLNKLDFDYQAEIIDRKTNQINFKIKVSIKGTNDFQLINKQFVATFNVLPIIEKVEIVGLQNQYKHGDQINLSANITMSNNEDVPDGLKYEWTLDGHKLSNQETCSFTASLNDNNKNLKLKAKYTRGESTKESIESSLVINKNDQQILDDLLEKEINRIYSLNSKLSKSEQLTLKEFNQIDEQYILENFKNDLELDQVNFDYKIINIVKNNELKQVSFNISVANKNKGNYQIISNKVFASTFNIFEITVSILGKRNKYVDEGIYVFEPSLRMLDGSEVPSNYSISYKWLLDDEVVLKAKTYRLLTRIADNGKKLKLRISALGKSFESDPIVLDIAAIQASITNYKQVYNEGEEIKLIAKVSMSDGSQIPAEVKILKYMWKFNDSSMYDHYGETWTQRDIVSGPGTPTKFRLTVLIQINSSTELCTYESEPLKIYVRPLIYSVSIMGIKPSFKEGEETLLKSIIHGYSNWWNPNSNYVTRKSPIVKQPDPNNLSDVHFEWLLDDNVIVSGWRNMKYTPKLSDNGKKMKFRHYWYSELLAESQEYTINVTRASTKVNINEITPTIYFQSSRTKKYLLNEKNN